MKSFETAEILEIGTHLVPSGEPTSIPGVTGASNAEFAARVRLRDGTKDLVEVFHGYGEMPDGSPADVFDFRASIGTPLNQTGSFLAVPPENTIKQTETLLGLEHPDEQEVTLSYARYILGNLLGIQQPRENDHWDPEQEVIWPSAGERLGSF